MRRAALALPLVLLLGAASAHGSSDKAQPLIAFWSDRAGLPVCG
jgi:hypothetical protein